MRIINYTLPEIVFLDGNSHEGNTLEDRTVILHVRSNTMLEVIALEDTKDLNLNCQVFNFTYKNRYQINESYLFAVHYTFATPNEMQTIFERCRDWYCAYLTWEDENIEEDATTRVN